MPKKKVILSGFSLLMKELQQERYEKEGRNIPLSQMKEIADPIWKKMSAEEKSLYNERAKDCRRKGNVEKLASDGTSIQHNMELIEEEEQRERQMMLNIRDMVNGNEQDSSVFKFSAARQSFYIMSFNILCCTSDNQYIPLEMAIVEYSIQKGILRHFHKFIYPGPVPTGFAGEAKRHSEETHQIPFSGHESSDRNYKAIVREIRTFMTPSTDLDEEYPPIFTLRETMEQTEGCIAWLCRKAGSQNFIRVWDLGYLLMELRAGAGEGFLSVMMAQEILTKNTFDYSLNTRCDFHEELDSAHCALGCVRRLCYLLSDCLGGIFNVDLTDRHLPVRAVESKPYEIHYPSLPNPAFRSQSRVNAAVKSSQPSRTSDDDLSDEDTDTPSNTYLHPRMPTSAIAQLKINAPTVAPGQGIGRGRLRKM